MIEPLRLQVDVDCDVEHAFATWTERFSSWWPRAHSVSGDPAAVVLEPWLGGRIFERTRGGTEIQWGVITVWDPPRRLAYQWHLRRPALEATDVEIRFVATERRSTRLEISQTGWERLGADAEPWRDANQGGWSGLLPRFVAACATSTTIEGGP
jgi:hypothetical protein